MSIDRDEAVEREIRRRMALASKQEEAASSAWWAKRLNNLRRAVSGGAMVAMATGMGALTAVAEVSYLGPWMSALLMVAGYGCAVGGAAVMASRWTEATLQTAEEERLIEAVRAEREVRLLAADHGIDREADGGVGKTLEGDQGEGE